jgi:probable HAF family extracellular repeat protein
MIRKRSIAGATLAALALGASVAAGSASASSYTVTDLGTFSGGYRSYAQGINGLGYVVGEADIARVYTAFRYTGSSLQNLGTLGGSTSDARGINDAGSVVGYSLNRSNVYRGFLWNPATKKMSDLGTLGGSASYAYAINNASSPQIAGAAYTAGDAALHAFLSTNGVKTDLGTLGSPSAGYGINSAAYGVNDQVQVVVVGGADTSTGIPGFNGPTHAFSWSAAGGMTDLGTLGGSTSAAYGINNAGQVVGTSDTPGDAGTTPVMWQGGQITDLGTLGGPGGAALGINSLGQVVGWAENPYSVRLAFLWQNGGLTDLNTLLPANSGWQLFQATAISSNGAIVGYGTRNGSAAVHAYLMKPAP